MFDLDALFSDGYSKEAFLVAEIGLNHAGDVEMAKRMIDAASDAGADAVKFQVFKTEKFYNPKILPEAFELFKTLELSFEDYRSLKKIAEEKGMHFFATALDEESLDFLIDAGVELVKVASSDVTAEPFLRRIASKHKKTILSTGFAQWKDIEAVCDIFKGERFALLYCVSKYPAEIQDYDLNVIPEMKKRFQTTVGFSDHSLTTYLSIAAVALGAKIIERHFTIDNSWSGVDHKISLNPQQFKEMATQIRSLASAFGSGEKKVTDFEEKIRYHSMRGFYSRNAIRAGETIEENDTILLRPGNGMKMGEYCSKLGKKAHKDIAEYEEI